MYPLCSFISLFLYFPLYKWPLHHTATWSIRQYIRSCYVGCKLHRFVAAWSSWQLEIYLQPFRIPTRSPAIPSIKNCPGDHWLEMHHLTSLLGALPQPRHHHPELAAAFKLAYVSTLFCRRETAGKNNNKLTFSLRHSVWSILLNLASASWELRPGALIFTQAGLPAHHTADHSFLFLGYATPNLVGFTPFTSPLGST